ncbi:MAG: carbohydrate porin [Gammaproteobacteria bacterium]|nr:carbohydrate porin [Gammaproteobacteria bacterium]
MRPPRPTRGPCAVLAAVLFGSGGAVWASDATPVRTSAAGAAAEVSLLEQIRRLSERLEQAEQRIRELEDARSQTEAALASDRISAQEPELVTRLKAVETETLSMQRQARQIEALEGISVDVSILSMAQQAGGRATADGQSESRLNYRGDIDITLPGGTFGDMDGKFFAQVRLGQGDGVGLRPTYTSTPNTTTFQVAGVSDPDSSFAVLGQAWYQLDVPLPRGGVRSQSQQHLTFNIGKMDPFVFFDQNAAADDESVAFVNNAFVHNPLLDSGFDIGADGYGFMPGARIAYTNERSRVGVWSVSLGVFGSGPAANFSGSLDQPLVIGQLELAAPLGPGLLGNYRLYAWRNGRARDFDGVETSHSGLGISADQRLGQALTLSGRYGRRFSGHGTFDDALTLGVEIGGDYWRRAADAIGIAAGVLPTSSAYRLATADGLLRGYAASGSERIAEIYYRYHLNDHVAVTPDLQWIQRPGGDPAAAAITVFGLRALVGL